MFATSLSDWPRKLDAGLDTEPLDAKKGESRKRHGTHISGKRKIISGQFPDTSRISGQFGQFLDNFRFRRIPADAGGFRRKGNRVFLVFSRISEIPAGRFRRIPADDQKSARNQTRNQSRNQKLFRNYFREMSRPLKLLPKWIQESHEVQCRDSNLLPEKCPKQEAFLHFVQVGFLIIELRPIKMILVVVGRNDHGEQISVVICALS